MNARGPVITAGDPAAWEAWLQKHGSEGQAVWLKLAKPQAAERTVTYGEALDLALCYGWIDGQKGALDAEYWLQRFSPRGPRSKWSQRNRARALELIAEGRMRPEGMREVERARSDGRWDAAYPGQRAAEVPPDLREALAAEPKAAEFFKELDGANRYAVLYRIHDAKRPQTRARRIAEIVAMLGRREKFHP